MAVRFAVKSGNWSDVTTWDSGTLPTPTFPTSSDTVYPNGYTVTIDQNVSIQSLNNNTPPVYVNGLATPAMTSNTQPTGTVISSNNSGTAYLAFDQNSSTFWASGVINTGWIGYTFPTSKVIKRYYLRMNTGNSNPKTWTFEGSNDGFATAGIQLDQVLSYTTNSNYISVLLANTTAYTSYRINVTATQGALAVNIAELEMTESTTASPVYGTTSGGLFTVSSALSGTINIVQTGAGMVTNNTAIFTTNHTSGNIVNFNVTSGGYIFNPISQTAISSFKILSINGTGAVNFNGTIYGCQTNEIENQQGLIFIGANATVTINGDIYLGKARTSYPYYTMHLSTGFNSAILNINGNIIAGNYSTQSWIYLNSASTINVVGNITSDIGGCILANNGSVNVTGNIGMTNTNSIAALNLPSALLTMNGSIVNKGNRMAIYAPFIRFVSTATPYWIFQTNAGTDMTLAYGSAIGNFPTEADVRVGVQYAASPTRTGTCAVPLPQYVSQGVATGSTVGTAYLNAADVWNILTSTITTPGSVGKLISDNLNETVSSRASQTSVDNANTNINNLPGNTADAVWNEATSGITTAGSIGERLKNASTVQTNGDQLAAYIV